MRFPNVDQTVALNYEAGDWATEGVKTDPNATTLLADTGQLAEGIYDFTILINSGQVSARHFELEHRNATNDANLKQQELGVGQYFAVPINIYGYELATNQRLRVVVRTNFTGTVQASIIWAKRV